MKLRLERDVLLAALTKAVGIVDRRSTIPILSNVLICADRDISLRTRNLDMEAMVFVAGEAESVGEMTLPDAQLLDIVKNLPQGAELTIAVTSDDPRAKLQCGRSRFSLPTLPADRFPILTPVAGVALKIPNLGDALERVAFCAGKDISRYMLTGVHVEANGSVVTIASTDTKRVATVECATPCATIAVTLPMPFVREAIRLATTESILTVSDRQARLEFEGGYLTSKVLEGEYLPFRRVIPAAHPHSAVLSRAALMASVRRALICGNDKDCSIKLGFSEGVLTVSARGQNSDEASDEIEVRYDAQDLTISTNGSSMLEALTHTELDEIEIQLKDSKSVMVIPHGSGVYVVGVHRA